MVREPSGTLSYPTSVTDVSYYRLRVVYPKAVIVLEPELVTELELEETQ